MQCKDANSYLCSYLDGELETEKVKAIEEHLKICQYCKNELEIQQSTKLFIQKRLPKFSAPESLKKRISLELSRSEEYRESGIKPLDLIKWGTHIAQFYNAKNELTEFLVPYLEEGLKNNELCVWITADISENEAKETLAKEISNLREYFNKNQLQIFSYKDWYLSDGYFNIDMVLNNAVNKCQESLARGYYGFRANGVISWLEKSDWQTFMEYERILNNVMPDQKALVICSYKKSKCTKDNIIQVIDRHKYSISKDDNSWIRMKSIEQFAEI